MYGHTDYIDDETLERAATECLEQPSDSAMYDDRLYSTHGAILGWADRSDDVLSESNYLCVLEYLEGIASDSERDDDVIDASVSHWAVGSLRQLFVRVRDDAGDFTPVFREAVQISLTLQNDYPVFDESDFSEREWAAFEEELSDAILSASNDHDDTQDDSEYFRNATQNEISEIGEWFSPDDVSWEGISEIYSKIRDSYFESLAIAIPSNPGRWNENQPDQEILPIYNSEKD